MKKYIAIVVLLISCAANKPTPTPVPVPIPTPAPKPKPIPVPDPTPITPGDDWSPIFQHDIDSCIANNIQVYVIPAGRYICKEPLICQKWAASAGYYVPFTLTIVGEGTFAEVDGAGTILDFSNMTDGFGIGFQGAKGGGIYGIKLIGAWGYPFPGAYQFYNTSLNNFTDGRCRDTRYSPYFAVVIDPFGPQVPSDGGYPKLSQYYKGQGNGSTGVTIDQCFFTNWVGGIITSPNGQTQNAELLIADKIQFANMKICVAGCQDQEKMNRVSNVMEWGVVHTCFVTGLYGAGSIGNWYFDHWNIAGYTNEIVYNNQGGYYPSYFDNIYAESIARIGTIYTINGTTFTNSSINFAGYVEAGSYTDGMISGYGVTFSGCQLRLYGQYTPITIATGAAANNMHFINCSFDQVPFYPQTYPYGYTDFQNCYVGGVSSATILNPIGRSLPSIYQYPEQSNVAAKLFSIDSNPHKFAKDGAANASIIHSDSTVTIGQIVVATNDFVTYTVAGIVAASSKGKFTVGYAPESIDTSKNYYIYSYKTLLK
jgi:hypothetical protein